ncbi:hypothetical protein G9F72_006520 [Clostridium estertheticum]|uniref:hypothetical protein n=1 Tax=Clostridium estertheticum TaxID=238834 RepID=UPI0013E93911|nr:hypothetical protein [Clostridium estertheticum]MBZ9685988.1 hypothetical protein [Clostridium estertheticum]
MLNISNYQAGNGFLSNINLTHKIHQLKLLSKIVANAKLTVVIQVQKIKSKINKEEANEIWYEEDKKFEMKTYKKVSKCIMKKIN